MESCLHFVPIDHIVDYQVQALDVALQDSKQARLAQVADSQHAEAGFQAQLKQSAGEVEVLKAGAGHAQEQALAALKVRCISL